MKQHWIHQIYNCQHTLSSRYGDTHYSSFWNTNRTLISIKLWQTQCINIIYSNAYVGLAFQVEHLNNYLAKQLLIFVEIQWFPQIESVLTCTDFQICQRSWFRIRPWLTGPPSPGPPPPAACGCQVAPAGHWRTAWPDRTCCWHTLGTWAAAVLSTLCSSPDETWLDLPEPEIKNVGHDIHKWMQCDKISQRLKQ